jgi:hypothetical protein
MTAWYKPKTKLDLLKKRYTELMRKSYRKALTNPEESDRVQEKAHKLYEEIQYLSLRVADK